jgi:hypothetical protein
MPEFEVVITKTTRETSSTEVTAANEEEAEKAVREMLAKDLYNEGWDHEDEELDFEINELEPADETEEEID